MKCLCFSDSHGSDLYVRAALLRHPDAEVVFFLGDGLRDVEELITEGGRIWYAVRGNCDSGVSFSGRLFLKTGEVELLGHRIVYTHGDLYGVKGGTSGLVNLAGERSAELVLYGHTHTPAEEYRDGVYYFNPGSIAAYGRGTPSYGIITLTEGGLLLSHGAL